MCKQCACMLNNYPPCCPAAAPAPPMNAVGELRPLLPPEPLLALALGDPCPGKGRTRRSAPARTASRKSCSCSQDSPGQGGGSRMRWRTKAAPNTCTWGDGWQCDGEGQYKNGFLSVHRRVLVRGWQPTQRLWTGKDMRVTPRRRIRTQEGSLGWALVVGWVWPCRSAAF